MVRTEWVNQLYGDSIFYPGYRSHGADNELTVIARALDMFVYTPECVLVEYDMDKDLGGSNPKDNLLFKTRYIQGFDGLAPMKKLESMAAEYKVNWIRHTNRKR